MSWISHRVTPQQCHEALAKWWKISGPRWLSGKDGDDEPEEMEMDAQLAWLPWRKRSQSRRALRIQNAGETDEPVDIAARTELEEMQGEEGACNLALGGGLAFVRHLSRAQVLGVTAGARRCNEWNKAGDCCRRIPRKPGNATANEVVNATSLQPVDSLKSGIIVAYVQEGQLLLGHVLTIIRSPY